MNKQEKLIQLILKDIKGTIPNKDKAHLYQLIKNDDENFEIYMRMRTKLEPISVEHEIPDLSGKIQQFFIRKVSLRWKVVITFFLIKSIAIAIFFLWYKSYCDMQLEKAKQANSFTTLK